MPERYLQFNSEQESKDASHQALVFANEYHIEGITYYLFPCRESIDGSWYLIYTDHPSFIKYETKALPAKIRNRLTDIEPIWVPDVEIG